MLKAATRRDSGALLRTRRKVARLVGEADADLLLTGPAVAASWPAWSHCSGWSKWRVANCRARRTPAGTAIVGRTSSRFRCPAPPKTRSGSTVSSMACAARRPTSLRSLTAGAPRPTPPRRARRHQHPRDAASVRKQVAAVGRAFREREAARSEVVRVFWPLRTFYLRAATLLNLGIPAVVGTGDATQAGNRTGDRLRVDGSGGSVELLSL